MAEPTTAITDFLMAGVALGLALRISGYWRFAFFFTCIGALIGGIYHASPSALLWKITASSVGIANLFLICAVARVWGRSSHRGRTTLMALAALEFFAYEIWIVFHDEFIYVIADYGSGLLLTAIVYLLLYRTMPRASRLVLGSIAVAVIAAAVQALRVTIHPRFNHNDLYHMIQIVSLILLYRGARASDISLSTASGSQ